MFNLVYLLFINSSLYLVQYYQHSVVLEGLDHCFDCARSVQIVGDYLRKFDDWCESIPRDAATGKLTESIPEADLTAQIVTQFGLIAESLKLAESKERREEAGGSHRGGKQQETAPASPVRQGGAEELDIEYEGLF